MSTSEPPSPVAPGSASSDGPAAGPAGAPGRRGLGAVEAEHFDALAAVGGVRGAVESVAPGLLFVVVFVASGQRLVPALVASAAAAVVAVVARLVQRTPVTQALSGVLGVAVGVVWAWRTGDAADYFAYGLWVNVAYLAGTLLSVLVRLPFVGLVLGLFRPEGPLTAQGSWAGALAWRRDPAQVRRYTWASWPWVGLFASRLAVQVPLYLAGEVAWLGTAKLVMGLPLTAVALWLSWVVLRGSGASRAPRGPRPAP